MTKLTTAPPTREPPLLPLHAMARMIGVSKNWLREQAEAGRIPHLNADGKLLFVASVVELAVRELASKVPVEIGR